MTPYTYRLKEVTVVDENYLARVFRLRDEHQIYTQHARYVS